jgi:uncharacterized protein
VRGPAGWAHVTGASSGLGEEYAVQLARRGHGLVLVARRAERLEALAERLRRLHAVPVHTVAADLLADEGLSACREALDRWPPGTLVLNAGYGSVGHLVDLDPATERDMVRLNCLAVLDLARHALPGMIARGRGDVVVMSSAAAFQGLPGMATYAATKAFELHLVEGLAGEVRGTGVRVVAVCPGPTRSEFTAAIDRDGRRASSRASWPWWMPMDEPEDVVAATWRALDAGRGRVVTGAVAHLAALGAVLPRPLVTRVADAVQRYRSRSR